MLRKFAANAGSGTPNPSRLWSFMPKPISTKSGCCRSTFSSSRCRPCAVVSPPVAPLRVSIRARGYLARSASAQRSQKINPGSEASPPAVMLSPNATIRTGCPARSFRRVAGSRAAPNAAAPRGRSRRPAYA